MRRTLCTCEWLSLNNFDTDFTAQLSARRQVQVFAAESLRRWFSSYFQNATFRIKAEKPIKGTVCNPSTGGWRNLAKKVPSCWLLPLFMLFLGCHDNAVTLRSSPLIRRLVLIEMEILRWLRDLLVASLRDKKPTVCRGRRDKSALHRAQLQVLQGNWVYKKKKMPVCIRGSGLKWIASRLRSLRGRFAFRIIQKWLEELDNAVWWSRRAEWSHSTRLQPVKKKKIWRSANHGSSIILCMRWAACLPGAMFGMWTF